MPRAQLALLLRIRVNSSFFVHRDVIEADRGKRILIGTRIRFYPTNLEDAKMAVLLEVLS